MDAITSPTQSAAPTATAPTTQPAIGAEFNSFLQLLTAQIRNQDPLAPLDSTQFVEQLATFSTLEQQVQSNTNLETIASTINSLSSLIANQWLGERVTVESSWVPFDGDPVEFEFDTPSGVDRAVLSIRDGQGNAILSEPIDQSAARHIWDGSMQDGTVVANDTIHQISIDLYRNGEFAGSVAPRLVTTVTNIGSEDGKLRLGTAMNLSADLSAVRKLGG